MNSLILQTTARLLQPLLILFSIILLLGGHNAPGGGFTGGLMAAAAFALYAIAYDVETTRRALRVEPRVLVAVGLLTAVASGVVSLLMGLPFMTGQWGYLQLPGLGKLDIGTPLVFDVGVYLVVLGIALLIVFPLAEE